jgi:hypothetical protein
MRVFWCHATIKKINELQIRTGGRGGGGDGVGAVRGGGGGRGERGGGNDFDFLSNK